MRQAFTINEPTLLPFDIIWRTKEAFSDGVSGDDGSWFKIIEEKVKIISLQQSVISGMGKYNIPITKEQQYYRYLYDTYYPNTAKSIPYFWMPRFVNATDSSARTLDFYKEKPSLI